MGAFDTTCPRCQTQATKPLPQTVPPPARGGQLPTIPQTASFGKWYYVLGGKRVGPVEESEIASMLTQGKIDRDTLVWHDGAADWLPLHQTDLARLLLPAQKIPAVTGYGVNNTIVWILAFAPFIGLFAEGFLSALTNSPIGNFWWATVAVNLGLSLLDARNLKNSGHDVDKFTAAAFFVPVYLFVRATKLKQNSAYAWVWVVCFLLSLGAASDPAAFNPSTPYDSWTLEHKLTGKRAVENPAEVTVTNLAAQAADASNMFSTPKLTATVTNGFAFPVGMVLVDVQFVDKSGAIISETTDSVGGIPAGGRWQMSVDVPQGADDAKVSRVLVVAP